MSALSIAIVEVEPKVESAIDKLMCRYVDDKEANCSLVLRNKSSNDLAKSRK